MFDAIVLDQTLLTVMPYEERRGREETAIHDRPKPFMMVEGTPFVIFNESVPLLQKFADMTLTAAELLADGTSAVSRAEVQLSDDEVVRARDARIALLARRHEGTASMEDSARFHLLTERIRKLMPRVAPKEFDVLTEMVEDAESIAGTVASIRSEFDIR
jgi:hypothetical protein